MDHVEQKIVEIIAEQAVMDVSDVKTTDSMEDLGIDSLGLVECIFGIEEAFDITVPFNANEPEQSEFDITSVQTVIDGVRALIAGQS